ncbi:CRISPR-associated protein Cas2 [Pelistega indica]|uniref:CRISPR-associated endoribonuclease Cas2 n=1 Tax=Pelistega indica TaxID=1414851 RepID=V8FSK7_9BURK|nr:CRISPR-associated endonuclease Cas2 [Pelistega indica]ETD67130.1 CRISPR-associated protein Cas2 [Pelistega indica]
MANRSLFLIAYDITCPKRQAKVRRILQSVAIGYQKSLFECWLTEVELHHTLVEIESIISKAENDKFHAFSLGEKIESLCWGQAKPMQFEPFLII